MHIFGLLSESISELNLLFLMHSCVKLFKTNEVNQVSFTH